MKDGFSLLYTSLLLLLLTTLLSSCAPAPGAPSAALKDQLQQLREQQQQQNEQVRALQQQLSRLEEALGLAPVAGESPAPTPPSLDRAPEQQAPAYVHRPDDQTPEIKAYLTAFGHLAAARYAAAESGFSSFLDRYPEHRQAPDARFRLAGAQVAQGKYDPAASNLHRIITDPRMQSRAPAAMLQLALLYRDQGRDTESDIVLHQLQERYPASPEAQRLLRPATD